MENSQEWKRNIIAVGTIVGAAIGLGTAYLLIRTAEEQGRHGPPNISTSDAIKAGLGIIGMMRGIAALGDAA